MSWFARKFTKSDIIDNKEVIKEYFEKKALVLEQQEIKKFWEEYGDEYFTGPYEERQDG